MNTPTPEIRQALYSHLMRHLPIGPVETGDIAWPNTGFKPNPKRVYLAPFVLFGETQTRTISPIGYEELSGIFQITICGLPKCGEGNLDSIARELTDIFRGGTDIELCAWQPITITAAYRSQLRYGYDGGRPAITVSANWHQFTQKGD